jgi:hypothetical protein
MDGLNEFEPGIALTQKFKENVCLFTISSVRLVGMVNVHDG